MLLKTVSGFEFFKTDFFRECLNAAWTIETFSGSFAAQNAAQDDRIEKWLTGGPAVPLRKPVMKQL